jgi:hypothetical protein
VQGVPTIIKWQDVSGRPNSRPHDACYADTSGFPKGKEVERLDEDGCKDEKRLREFTA